MAGLIRVGIGFVLFFLGILLLESIGGLFYGLVALAIGTLFLWWGFAARDKKQRMRQSQAQVNFVGQEHA